MLGASAGRAPSFEEARKKVHELLQSPEWSGKWLAVLDDMPAPSDAEMEGAGVRWLLDEFPWAHGRTIITTRAAEWVQEGGDSWEVSAAEQRRCDQCGRGGLSGAMQKCGRCRLVYYCSVGCQKAGRSKHKAACVPRPSVADVTGLSVGSFAEDEACSWMQSTVRRWRGDDAGVLELVQYLGCLPLAVGLVSAYAVIHHTATAGELLDELKRTEPMACVEEGLRKGGKVELRSLKQAAEHNGKRGQLLEYSAGADRWVVELSGGDKLRVRPAHLVALDRDECPQSLRAVVKLTAGKMRKSAEGGGKAAEQAMRKLALLDTTGMLLELLSRGEKQAVEGLLKKHAMVTEDDKGLWAMHALTQRAVRGQVGKGERGSLVAGVARALAEKLAKFDHNKPATYFIGRRYAAHARAVATQAGEWGLLGKGSRAPSGGGQGEGRASLLGDVGLMCRQAGRFFLMVNGQYRHALGVQEVAMDCALALGGPENPMVAHINVDMGLVHERLGDYGRALFHHSKAQEVFVTTFGDDCLDTAATFNNMAVVYEKQGKYEKALFHYGKAQEVFVAIHGYEHLDVAKTHGNIGNVHESLGDYEKALFHHGKALEVFVAVYGDGHLDTAKTQENMANVYLWQGMLEKALEIYNSVLQTKIRVCGADSPLVAMTNMNIGVVYEKLGRFEEALVQHGKAQEVYIAVYGDMHPLVATTVRNIADVYLQQGRFEEALFHYRKAQEVFVAVYGDRHPNVASTHVGLGNVRQKLGDYEKALFHYGKAQEVYVAVYGDMHLQTAATLNNMGNVYQMQGKYEQALEAYSKSLDIKIELVGDRHPDVSATYSNIGVVYESQGRYEEALVQYGKALEIVTKVHGSRHLDVAKTHSNMANAYVLQGKYEQALEAYTKSLDITIKLVGQDCPESAATLSHIATVYHQQGQIEKALEVYQQALEIEVKIGGHDSHGAADSKYNMAALHQGHGKLDEAKQLFLESQTIYAKVLGPEHSKAAEAARQARKCDEERQALSKGF